MRFAFLAFVVALLAACGGSDDKLPVATSGPTSSTTITTGQGGGGGATTTASGGGEGGATHAGGEGGTTHAGGSAQGGGGSAGHGGGGEPPVIDVPATDGQKALPFAFGAAGQGSHDIGVVSMSEDTGVVNVKGHDVPALAYERQPFGEWTLYQVLGVEPDRLWVMWMYCKAGALEYVYLEGTDGTKMHYEQASGTCAETVQGTAAKVKFPAVHMGYPTPLAGYTLSGADVTLPGAAPGSITLGNTDYALLAFDDVDCTQKCGAPGWREIHTLLWDEPGQRLCFAIIYLFKPGQDIVIEYSISLPDLSDPAGTTQLAADFTTP
jgi:hypothetical protein